MGVTKPKVEAKRPGLADLPLPASVVGLLNRHQVCKALGGVCVRKLNGMISAGVFPRADKRLGKSPRWSVALVNRWVETLPDDDGPNARAIGRAQRSAEAQ